MIGNLLRRRRLRLLKPLRDLSMEDPAPLRVDAFNQLKRQGLAADRIGETRRFARNPVAGPAQELLFEAILGEGGKILGRKLENPQQLRLLDRAKEQSHKMEQFLFGGV